MPICAWENGLERRYQVSLERPVPGNSEEMVRLEQQIQLTMLDADNPGLLRWSSDEAASLPDLSQFPPMLQETMAELFAVSTTLPDPEVILEDTLPVRFANRDAIIGPMY
ncbi:MAG: hypothetical protein AAFV53_28565 [Myxococcota bacterium]